MNLWGKEALLVECQRITEAAKKLLQKKGVTQAHTKRAISGRLPLDNPNASGLLPVPYVLQDAPLPLLKAPAFGLWLQNTC